MPSLPSPHSGVSTYTPPACDGQTSPQGASDPYDILIVEDDPTLRSTIAEALELDGYRTVGARDGVDALGVLDRVAPWLILLDLRMPVMKGPEFAREIRRRGIDTKILVMTAARNMTDLTSEVRADGYLAKPFQIGELLTAVKDMRPPV